MLERLTNAWSLIEGILHNWWHHVLIFGEVESVPGAGLKTALLVALPIILLLAAIARRRVSDALRITVALVVSFFVVSLVFGTRLGGHHYVVLLPFFYAVLVLVLRDATAGLDTAITRPWATALPLLLLVGSTSRARCRKGKRSRARAASAFTPTRSIASPATSTPILASLSCISRTGACRCRWPSSRADAWAWIRSTTTRPARHRLCHGQNVGVALVGADRDARFTHWQEELRWTPPARTPYAQADGEVLFELGVFVADPKAPACGPLPRDKAVDAATRLRAATRALPPL